MTTTLIILYIVLSISNRIVKEYKFSKDKDLDGVNFRDFSSIETKGFLKPYTLTILSSLIAILFFIKLNILLSFCFIINTLIDIRKGE